jgi:hypothetical protein
VTGTFPSSDRNFKYLVAAHLRMVLSDIAAGIEVTTEQRDRGVPTVDDTDADLASRLEPHADGLPCTAAAAATLLDSYFAGASVGAAASDASVAPTTAAKALFRCGVTGVSPLAPTARDVVRDWLSGDLSRADALALTGADEADFALAAYVESHDPVDALVAAVEAERDAGGSAAVAKRDELAETMSDVADLR